MIFILIQSKHFIYVNTDIQKLNITVDWYVC